MLRNIVFNLLFTGLIVSFATPAKALSLFKKEEPVQKQEVVNDLNATVEKQKVKVVNPSASKKVYEPNNEVGIKYIENVIEKANFYIEENDIESAKQSINSINEWVYDATEFHTSLFKTLNGLQKSEAQADVERNLAIKYAILRDKTIFLEAKVLVADGKKREAVEKLVEIVRSQPSTELGFASYKMLQDLGFTYKIQYEFVEKESAQ